MLKNPLAEVFGFPPGNMTAEAITHRQGRLCPFHNSSGINCTKNSATDPLGVCTIVDGQSLAVTCPVRFRQDFRIIFDAAQFFFPGARNYISLTEVRLNDGSGKSAGNIDIVIAELDDQGQLKDFGALEVQAVYISGNVSNAFKKYMEDPANNHAMHWPAKNYPKPDYLSSSRKRLAPQLIYKGGILNAWQKKMAVAVHRNFFNTLPEMPQVEATRAEIAWFVYDLVYDEVQQCFQLEYGETRYTLFQDALNEITKPSVGAISTFERELTKRIKIGKMIGQPPQSEVSPDTEPLTKLFSE